MGKLWMPMNNFKKVSEDQKSATLQHPDGHQIVLAKNILSPSMLQQLAALPMHDREKPNPGKSQPNLARGGKVKKMDDGGQAGGTDDGFLKKLGRAAMAVDQSVTPQKLMQSLGYVDQNLSPQAFGNSLDYVASKVTGQQPNPQPLPASPFTPQPGGQQQQSPPSNYQLPSAGGGGNGGGGGGGNPNDPYGGGIQGMYGGHSPMWLANQGYNSQLGGAKAAQNAVESGTQQAMGSIDSMVNQKGNGLLQQNLNNFWNGWKAPDGSHVPGYLESLQEFNNVKQDVLTNKIDPNRWINSGVLPKIITGLGLLGAMSNSKGSGEQILSFVQGQMDNDIKAQIADKSGKINILQANLQQMGNMKDAVTMTGIQYQGMLSAMLERAAQSTQNQMAKANYMMYAGQIYNQAAQQLYGWKMNQVLAMNPDAGAGYGSGAAGGGGGAQAGGCGPTDATGRPMPRGIPGVNGPMFQQYGPVNMPAGGTRFAGPNAGDANNAINNYRDLDAALQHFKDVQSSPSLPSFLGLKSAGRQAQENAAGDVKSALRNMAHDKRLTPYQQKQIEDQGNSLVENPWIFGRGRNEQTINDIANRNNDIMGNALNQDLYGGYTPRQAPKRWKPGG